MVARAASDSLRLLTAAPEREPDAPDKVPAFVTSSRSSP